MFVCQNACTSLLQQTRLSAQLLQTTWQQLELQIEQDMMKLQEWSNKFEAFSAKQAHYGEKSFNR